MRLRWFLATLGGGVPATSWYFEKALPRFSTDPEARLVVEELIDHVARLMSFEAERDDEAGVSVWSSASGPQLVVSAIDSMEAVTGAARVSRSCEQLRADGKLRPEGRASTLCVICGQVRYRLLEQAATVRRAPEPLRLVSLDALLTLARAIETAVLSHAAAAIVLGPPSVFADSVIALVVGSDLEKT